MDYFSAPSTHKSAACYFTYWFGIVNDFGFADVASALETIK
jgi:hypothetical protein